MIVKPFGLTDLLDIACVATCMYGLLVWLKRTKTAFVTIGLFIFIAVYAFARIMGMVMTVWLFQGFFAVFIIVVIVIFQEDIRRVFERIAVWSVARGNPQPFLRETEVLLRTLAKFSADKIGCLMVLCGRDPIDRHIEGGWDLQGRISEALIESIFDWHSLGHDGAVIVDQGLVTRFGCHLPLSNDFSQMPDMGTRHAAALGLSERADALCLVVSEEKGTISIAEAGRLVNIPDFKALQERIEGFYHEKERSIASRPIHNFATRNVGEKAVALAVAVVLWLFFVGLGLR